MFSRVGWSGALLSVPGPVRVVRFLSASEKTSALALLVWSRPLFLVSLFWFSYGERSPSR